MVVDNTLGNLLPGAYADVVIQRPRERRLVVPEEAVLRDSQGAQVMVALGAGRFQPRAVRAGISAAGYTEILAGLNEQETVVISGQFLLDSEARLRRGRAAQAAVSSGAALDSLSLSATEFASFDHLTDGALYLHEALTDGYRIEPAYLDPALAAAAQLRERYRATALHSVLVNATAALEAAKRSGTKAELREALAVLVEALMPWLEAQAQARYAPAGLRRFHDATTGYHWLQQNSEAVNPYGAPGWDPASLVGAALMAERSATLETGRDPRTSVVAALLRWSVENPLVVLLLAAGLGVSGWLALDRVPLDAVPDLTDTQVIIRTDFPGQSPQLVEDLVTYPLATQLLGLPRTKDVRGTSMFGTSFVYVVFEDDVDQYWARSRVAEALARLGAQLPAGARPQLGPDATGVGWVYQYALVDRSGRLDLAELRSLQDWFLKLELAGVDGVAEVASVGGFVREYQVLLDPNRLRSYDLSLAKVRAAVEAGRSSSHRARMPGRSGSAAP